METLKVNIIDTVKLQIIKINPPSLLIKVKGENENNNFTNIRLEPFVYITPPADGIWEFSMVGDAPEFVDHIHTFVEAEYTWQNFPSGVKGIKVYGATNSVTTSLTDKTAHNIPGPDDIRIIKADAWVDTQPVQPTSGGTLVVDLIYNSNDRGFHTLKPAIPQGINPKILILEITHSNELIFIVNPRHNNYSQGLQEQSQYSSIEFVYKGKTVGAINNIRIIK